MTTILKVHPKTISPNPVSNQIYTDNPDNYTAIKENIAKVGILEPLIVNPETKVVISGNIRLKVAHELGLNEIPVINASGSDHSDEILVVSHGQQRVKKPSEILREREIWERAFPVTQGARTDLNPQLKKNKKMLESIDLGVKPSKIQLLKAIDKLAKKLYGEGSEQYFDVWEKVDSGKAGLRSVQNKLSQELAIIENSAVLPEYVDIIDTKIQVYNGTCRNMYQVPDATVACIFCSPPYFRMRDYGTGEEQRGLETDVNEYVDQLVGDFTECWRVLKKDGSLWININEPVVDGQYRHISHRVAMKMQEQGWIMNDEWVWIKPNAVFTDNKRAIRSHEYIFHFVKDKNFYYDKSWLSDIEDKDNAISVGTEAESAGIKSSLDFRDSVITHSGNNMNKLRERCREYGFNLTHTAGFPIALPEVSILTTSRVGDTVLDIFSGTGTTGESALSLGRSYIGYEIKSEFVLSAGVRLERFLETTSVPELLAA